MADKRIFIGFDISDEARQRAEAHIKELRKAAPDVRVGWEKPEKLHVTVKFLGDVDEGRLASLSRMIEGVAADHRSSRVKLIGTGVFPNDRQPRILWLGIENNDAELSLIAASVEQACSELGFKLEDRKFKPHVTIARIRDPQKGRPLAAMHLRSGFEPVEFAVSQIVVYESKLGPGGSAYAILTRHSLGAVAATYWPDTSR